MNNMGELAEDFAFMKKVRKEERAKVEPTRFEYATDLIMNAGHRVSLDAKDDKVLVINDSIKLWPYTGWWSGKGIGSGRGVHNLIKKLASQNK